MEEKAVAELDPVLTKTGFTKAVEMIYEDMGIQMAKTLGVEKFGGNVQTSGVKKVGYSYWCTANKDMYRCKVENSLNYIDDTYFDAFSNASLLGKLQNLFIGYSRYKYKKISIRVTPVINPNFSTIAVYNCGIVRLSEYLEGGDIISALIYDTEAELCSINKYNNNSVTIEYIRNSSSATPVSNFNIDLIIGFN